MNDAYYCGIKTGRLLRGMTKGAAQPDDQIMIPLDAVLLERKGMEKNIMKERERSRKTDIE